jgi:hypothetical protein
MIGKNRQERIGKSKNVLISLYLFEPEAIMSTLGSSFNNHLRGRCTQFINNQRHNETR